MTASRSRNARGIIGSLGIVGAAAAVAGVGTFGSFTDSTAPLDAAVSSGTLSLDLTAGGTAGLTMNAAGFVPGDSISRSVDLVNSGDLAMDSISLTSVASTNSLLDTDKTNGLKLTIDTCAVKWTESTSSGVTAYSCAPGSTPFVSTSPVTGSMAPGAARSINPRGVDHLVVTVGLPTTAGNELQGKSSNLAITFVGVQKTGINR